MKELFEVAINACADVYEKNIDLGTTEYQSSYASLGDEYIQVLAIAGSNETKDWWINFDLRSCKGIKKGAYDAAVELYEAFKSQRDDRYPLLVTGHSKAGATCIAYKKLFPADWCVSFAPARSLRYWTDRKMADTYLFKDPDDPVTSVGSISFGHPICEHFELEDDHVGIHLMDHHPDNFKRFIANMPA